MTKDFNIKSFEKNNRNFLIGIYKISIFLLILSFYPTGFAKSSARMYFNSPSWNKDFYTDDSSKYLTLFTDGFSQKIRFQKKVCDSITKVSIQLKDSFKGQKVWMDSTRVNSLNVKKYYGLETDQFCWFEATVRGLSLESAESIKYVLKIEGRNSSQNYYYTNFKTSLLPSERLTDQISNEDWMDLGAFGATAVLGGGVFFKIWEPHAERVDLFLNNFSPKQLNSVNPLGEENRFHFLFVPEARLQDRYYFQFVKNKVYENIFVANFKTLSPIKIDPMAKELVYENKGGFYNGIINPQGVVTQDQNEKNFQWKNRFTQGDIEDSNLIIYQLWPLTFNPQKQNGKFLRGQYLDILPKLDYLTDLGINAVELLPVNFNRFNISWGYALDSLMIVDDSMGTSIELKKMIDELHGKNIRVIFDAVVNHVNNSLIRDPLSADTNESKFYHGNTDWGPRPRFESLYVQKWLMDSILYLCSEYHLDGLRFDMTDSVFNGDPVGYQFLQDLVEMIKLNHPNIYLTAEQLPDNVWVTFPKSQNGLGFDSQWNDRFKNFFELEFDNYRSQDLQLDLTFLAQALGGYSDQKNQYGQFYHFGSPQRTVNYLGSHDFIGNKNPLIRIISGYFGQEKSHNNSFVRVNPREVSSSLSSVFRSIHNTWTHAVARVAYGILFTKPGASLFFQGEELAQDLNLENEWSYMDATNQNRFPSQDVDVDRYVRSHRMPWDYDLLAKGQPVDELSFLSMDENNLFKGHLNFFKAMIEFKKEHPEINLQDVKNIKYDNESKIFIYEIVTSKSWFFIVLNFGVDHGGTWIPFPGNSSTWWSELINSSEFRYGGSDNIFMNGISNVGGRLNLLRLKGPGFYLFEAGSFPNLREPFYLRTSLNNWSASNANELKFNPQYSDELMTTLTVPLTQNLEFKVANYSWEMDLGRASQFSSPIYEDSTLTTIPHSPNVQVKLEPGEYLFKFNIRTYKFIFEKLNRSAH